MLAQELQPFSTTATLGIAASSGIVQEATDRGLLGGAGPVLMPALPLATQHHPLFGVNWLPTGAHGMLGTFCTLLSSIRFVLLGPPAKIYTQESASSTKIVQKPVAT